MGSPIIKQWLGWGWLQRKGWTSQSLTRRMSAWDSQSSQPVWPLGLALLAPPSGRRCQRDAGPGARPAPPYRHRGLPGSRPWGCGAWSPNNNALKWERGHGRVAIYIHAVVPFWLLFVWQEISRARYAQTWSFFKPTVFVLSWSCSVEQNAAQQKHNRSVS